MGMRLTHPQCISCMGLYEVDSPPVHLVYGNEEATGETSHTGYDG